LCGLYFEEHKYFNGLRDWQRNDRHALLRDAARQLDEYFAGRRIRFKLALDLRGTPFQQSVWRALLALPFGATSHYGEIAHRVDNPKAIRATGAAIGRNPMSIIVPCHRVLGVTSDLSGYAGGLDRKRFLLDLEHESAALSVLPSRAA
jgi:methylated-DNA-[protein]-cysteine S-methyltransferase